MVDATTVNAKYRMLDNHVLVENIEYNTGGGLVYIPDTLKEASFLLKGRVIAVGPGRVTRKGIRIPVDLSVGDIVWWHSIDGINIPIDGGAAKGGVDLVSLTDESVAMVDRGATAATGGV